jgi:hypothetical protein
LRFDPGLHRRRSPLIDQMAASTRVMTIDNQIEDLEVKAEKS